VLHTAVAVQQSGFTRGLAIVGVIAVAGLYLYVRELRGKRRRSHRP
jgi:hypothetical protein